MKLIIDISEHMYNTSCMLADIDGSPILKIIKNGILLPKYCKIYQCSNYGEKEFGMQNFCSNCGADMRNN